MKTRSGLEVFLGERLDLVAGKRAALVACPSSVDRLLRSSVELLHKNPDINLVALFGPEHGLRGQAQAGEHVSAANDPVTGLPVHSLFGHTYKPKPDMLAGLDVIIIDLQDGGVRFYTYLATISHIMEASAEVGLQVILLDRPAQITAARVEGPVLDPAFTSFVGPHPVPLRYGMTIGEMAQLVNETFDIDCDLTVVPLADWSREMWYDQTGLPFLPSSPNLPTLDSMTVYPGTCLIEGTNLSEGRGTTRSFEYIGAPWINAEALSDQLNALNLAGARFRPVYFVPTFSKYQGELCAGVQVYVTDRDAFQPLTAILQLLQTVIRDFPEHFAWREPWSDRIAPPIDLLSGSDALRKHLDAGLPVSELIASWEPGLNDFEHIRQQFMLYST